MKQLIWIVVGLLLLVPTVDALECIAIKTAAINPATRECAYFETVCLVPSGWKTVSYCPDDDIQFFTLSKYLPALGLLFGSFLGFFILTIILRRFLFSLDQKSEESYAEPSEPFFEKLMQFFRKIHLPRPSFRSFFQSLALKGKVKTAFSQNNDHRSVYRQDIQTISEVVHAPILRSSSEEKAQVVPLPTPKQGETQGTDWNEFKDTLKKLESLDKKKQEK